MERIEIRDNNTLYYVYIEHWLTEEQLWKVYSTLVNNPHSDVKKILADECGIVDVRIVGGNWNEDKEFHTTHNNNLSG